MCEASCTRMFCDQARSEGEMESEKSKKNDGQSGKSSDGEESKKSAEESCRQMFAFEKCPENL